MLRSTGGEQDTATQEAHASSRHVEPDPSRIWGKQKETVEHILEYCPKNRIPREKLRTAARKYFEPRETLIYQLVLESDN